MCTQRRFCDKSSLLPGHPGRHKYQINYGIFFWLIVKFRTSLSKQKYRLQPTSIKNSPVLAISAAIYILFIC